MLGRFLVRSHTTFRRRRKFRFGNAINKVKYDFGDHIQFGLYRDRRRILEQDKVELEEVK